MVIFGIGFFAVNLDLGPKNGISAAEADPIQAQSMTAEIKSKLGSTSIYMESYADWAKRFGLNNGNDGLDTDPDHDGLPNYLEYAYGTNPLKADTDGDGYSDKQEITNGYDPDAPGNSDARPSVEISIAKIDVEAPMVWSQSDDQNAMLADLENGLSHFPKTAAPGQVGNMIVSGHSSNYVWAAGNYNHIFKDLNDVAVGDIITVRTIQQNGRTIVYQYKVNGKYIDAPDDLRIFSDTPNPTLTLSTCWPLGTNLKRLIVKADLMP